MTYSCHSSFDMIKKIKEDNMNICQSCGMPMQTEELQGLNKDGSKCEDYCIYCYPNGEFNSPNETLEEMIESCIPFMMKEGLTEEESRLHLQTTLKSLKRWQKNKK